MHFNRTSGAAARRGTWRVPPVLIAAAALSLFGQEPRDKASAQIENLMRQLHDRGQFDGAVLVAGNGKILYRGAFGLSDRKLGISYKPETPSCLASLSKPFTALAILMLAEKHRLNYDDGIARYLPELPDALGAATIRQLLTHTSGIPDYSSDLNVDRPGVTTADVLNALRKVDRPLFSAGEKYQYSNTGYLLLGLIIERLSGKPLPSFLQEHIFTPLRMKATFTLTGGRQKTSDVARGYDDFGSPDDTDGYLGGEGGIYSTVDDLLAFDQALYTDRLVKQRTLNEAFKPGVVRVGETTYGLGWNVTTDASGGKLIWHTGNTAGFRAFMGRGLDARTTVILLTNRGNSKRLDINQAIQSILAGKAYAFPRKSIAVAMRDVILQSDIEAGLAFYQSAKTAHAADYDFGEGEINTLGYRLLYQEKRPEDAVKIFLLNATEHKASSNAFDSLAEAYQVVGDKAAARKYYEVALEKDAQNLHAKRMLEKLQ